MYCGSGGNPSAFPDDSDGISACYRSLLYLTFPALVGILGSIWASLQESKVVNKRTKIPIHFVLRHIGTLDFMRISVFFIAGFMPLIQWFSLNHLKDVVEFTVAIGVDTLVLGVFPWCFIASGWLVYEISRGSQEWGWIRMFSLVQLLGESLMLWSVVKTLHADFPDSSELRYWTVVLEICTFASKLLACFLLCCFNRDWRRLRSAVRQQSSELRDPLLQSSFGSFQDEEVGEPPKELPYCLDRTPEEYAGLFSRIFYLWMEPIMRTGYQRTLDPEDLYRLLKEDETKTLARSFGDSFQHLREEKAQQDGLPESKEGSLNLILRALHNAGIITPFYEAAFFKFIYDTLMFAGPQLLKHIISFLKSPDEPLWKGYMYAGLMFATTALQTIVLHIYFHRCFRTGMRVRTTLITAIYRKSLRLTPAARQERTTGEVVNLMSTDCERLNSLFPYLHITWSSPYQVALSLYFLWNELQYSVLVAVAIIFLVMTPLTALVAGRIKMIQLQLMKVKDERIRVTGEAITSMKVIKLYGWEKTFRDSIHGARESELKLLRTYVIWRAASRTLWTITPTLVTLATFATYVLSGNELDTETAFTSLALLNILRFPLAVLPNIFNSAVEAAVSLRRISNFLESEELDIKAIETTCKECPSDLGVFVEHGNYFWDDAKNKPALKSISLSIPAGSIAIVTGEVGSGKSALLNMLIGELQPETEGPSLPVIGINGTLAYASQVPWIQNASVKENIIFGSTFDEEWYDRVVVSCSLSSDFDLLPNGDQTEIGERGINLSGGQKARVALARAVYSRADVLLLESCFEAVDEHVGTFLWNKCFMGLLREPNPTTGKLRTVLLVTHALSYGRQADTVIVMKNGEVVEQGRFNDIVQVLGSELSRLAVRVKEARRESVHSESEADETHEAPVDEVKSTKPKNGNLTGVEERSIGSVDWSVYNQYMQANGGVIVVISVLVCLTMRTFLDIITNAWLSVWSKASSSQLVKRLLFSTELLTEMPVYEWNTSSYSTSSHHGVSYYLGIYSALSLASVALVSLTTLYVAFSALKASRTMHTSLVISVCRAPMSFFDTTPIGRILNRFSKDIYTVDESLPDSLFSFLSTAFSTLGTIGAISYVVPAFLGVVPFLAIMYGYVQSYYIASSRELKRLDSVLRSPIYSHFSESLDGVSTIRAYGADKRFLVRNQAQVDSQLSAYYISIASNRWLAVRMEFIGNFLVFFTSLFVIIYRGSAIDYGMAALAVSYALQVTQTLNWTVRMVCDLETNAVSVERLNEYIQLKPEASEASRHPELIPSENQMWPSKGEMVFQDVFARYRPGLENVLKGLDMKIEGGEKVGIVGRTGAGKSSLFLVLLRLMEPSGGKILIDGYDLQNFGVTRLRRNIAIIPQDPVMFSASLRKNLDPTGEYTDEAMMNALEITQLKSYVISLQQNSEDSPLDFFLSEGGSNFSFGQRQLICIARAVLRQCKIILLDEATSGVDGATDDLMQITIRTEFKNATVLTIAHRLETIMGCDQIAVMDAGRLAEYAPPATLLQNPKSMFSELVKKMNHKD